jgi:hypothetical protein
MVDDNLTVEMDYDDGFREGFLQGFMAAYMSNAGTEPCDRDDCPRKE